jgi:predicted deacylase
MLKNVQEAKFNSVLKPIAEIVLAADQKSKISFEQFFTHILAHELMHGLGPHSITINGKKTTVRQEMKKLSSALEEAKADIAGLFALQFLMDKGIVDKVNEESLYITYLASAFRSVRFGTNDAHGKGQALQFNYLVDEGAFVFDKSGETFSVNIPKVKEAVKKLTGAIMTIQAEGNYTGAKDLLDLYGIIRPEMQSLLDKMNGVPTDIVPIFPHADGMK